MPQNPFIYELSIKFTAKLVFFLKKKYFFRKFRIYNKNIEYIEYNE